MNFSCNNCFLLAAVFGPTWPALLRPLVVTSSLADPATAKQGSATIPLNRHLNHCRHKPNVVYGSRQQARSSTSTMAYAQSIREQRRRPLHQATTSAWRLDLGLTPFNADNDAPLGPTCRFVLFLFILFLQRSSQGSSGACHAARKAAAEPGRGVPRGKSRACRSFSGSNAQQPRH